eukprot:scaffold3667_cov180-Amphora_coffeaeformis.AAC.8
MRKETIPVDDQSSTLQSSDGPLPGSLALELQKEAPPAAVHPLGVMTSSPLRVLLKYLEKVNDDSLRKHAKAIIAECTVRNRNGDSDYLCLQGAVERRLQQNLGRWHWDRAQICYHRFLERCRMPSTIAVTSSACV